MTPTGGRGDGWLDGIVDKVCDALGDEAALGGLLERLRQDFGCSAAALISHDFAHRRGIWCFDSGVDPSIRRSYAEYFAERNPWLGISIIYQTGRVHLGSEIIADSDLVRTEFYDGFLRRFDAHHRLCGVVLRDRNETCFLSLMRSRALREFDARDRHDLGSLVPHLHQMLRVRRTLLRRCAGYEPFDQLLRLLPEAVLVVDRDAKLVFRNEAAARIAQAGDGLAVRGGRLVAESRTQNAELRRLVAATVLPPHEGGAPGGRLVVARPSGRHPYVLVANRLGCDHADDLMGHPEPLVAIVTRDPDADAGDLDLATVYRLTRAEARLCGLVVTGITLAEAAERLGISRNTARTHMKQVYAKTGTHRAAELTRLVSRAIVGRAGTDRLTC